MAHGGVGGAYWVATLPEHRSKGVGRALMHAVLRHALRLAGFRHRRRGELVALTAVTGFSRHTVSSGL
ncbi:MAG: hypothetical protein QOI78_4799 [Actinomycetota bacterium]|jgi:GNAT superfamily N-acetyltransferase|nr:hypothetical protein [Actinomycetota bacterium]